jgi:hypothetical protein
MVSYPRMPPAAAVAHWNGRHSRQEPSGRVAPPPVDIL